eukprot:Awhi_evm1s9199
MGAPLNTDSHVQWADATLACRENVFCNGITYANDTYTLRKGTNLETVADNDTDT